MAVAILKSDGSAIEIASFIETVYDPYGFLISFKTNDTYKYYQVRDFKRADRNGADLEGYYVESEYLNYVQGFFSGDSPNITQMVDSYKFNFIGLKASVGEPVTVNVVDYGDPYDNYYQEKQYTFNLQASIADSKAVKSYKLPVYDNLTVIDYQIDIPTDAAVVINNIDRHNEPDGYFYAKNFGDNVKNGWAISDAQKNKFKKTAVLIAYKIHSVLENIFPTLLDPGDMAEVDIEADNTSSDISNLSDLLKAVFLMKKSWGYYYSPLSDPSLVHRQSFDAIFSSAPDYDEFWYYYIGLSDFYANCYLIPTKLIHLPDSEKLNYLLRILPISALSVFPFVIITNALSQLMSKRILTDSDEELIVRLTNSVTPKNADAFLDFLLNMDNGTSTNFEVLYKLISDARLERIPFVSWIVDEQTYRKYFVYKVYNLWETSKYNFNYFPEGTPGSGVNLNSYFILNSDEFVINNVLTFLNSDSSDGNNIHTNVNFNSDFSGKKVKINIVTKKNNYVIIGGDHISTGDSTNETLFGLFHLYQPIGIAGYQPNLEFTIPQNSTIPAFLFHYIDEFDRLADFDAGIALAINLTADILIAYFTGAASLLDDLRYLQYLPKLGQALLGSLPADEAVVVFKGVEVGSTAISLSAGSLAQINTYLITVENDPAKKAVLISNQKLFLAAIILSGGISVYGGAKVLSQAKEALSLITDTSEYNTDLISLLNALSGESAVTVTAFGNKLSTLDLNGADNNIFSKYSEFSDEEKLAFYNDFQGTNASQWIIINKGTDGVYIDNWQKLYENGIAEASVVDFITNQTRVDAILYYHESPQIETILQSLSYNTRVLFLDTFGSTIDLDIGVNSLDLLLEAQTPLTSGKDVYTTEDVLEIINSNLSEKHIGFLVERNKITIANAVKLFTQNINTVDMTLESLKSVYNQLQDLIDSGASKQLDEFLSSNRLFSTTVIKKNGDLVDTVSEIFISGGQAKMDRIFSGSSNGALEAAVTEPSDYSKFMKFSLKAVEGGNKRSFDTEMKYIFNFIEKHYDLGDDFTIEMNSILYSCDNCQRYMQALQNMAKADGKIIEIKFIAHPSAFRLTDVKSLTK